MGATGDFGAGVGEGELAPSMTDLSAVVASCLNSALKSLTPQQRSQLQSNIVGVRGQVTAGADLITQRQTNVNNQITLLQNQLAASNSDSADVVNFFILFSPAVASCPAGQTTASQIKAVTDRAALAAYELQYQINLAKIMSGNLTIQQQEANATLASLDQINLILSQA